MSLNAIVAKYCGVACVQQATSSRYLPLLLLFWMCSLLLMPPFVDSLRVNICCYQARRREGV